MNKNKNVKHVYENTLESESLHRWLDAESSRRTPRTPEILLEMLGTQELDPKFKILDAGCGDGTHTLKLLQRFPNRITALDPVEANLSVLSHKLKEFSWNSKVDLVQASLEQMPLTDGEFSAVWCRGVLVHIQEIEQALAQCFRVLKPGGCMVVLATYSTDLIEPRELAELNQRFAFAPEGLSKERTESAFLGTGFRIEQQQEIGGEFAEHYESISQRSSVALTQVARLLRFEPEALRRFGKAAFDSALAMAHWHVYQMLGKISYHAYLLIKDETPSEIT